MRVVTFQDREITKTLLKNGLVETKLGFPCNSPARLRRTDYNKAIIQLNDKIITYDYDRNNIGIMYDVYKCKTPERIFPFYTYHKHSYCGDVCNMSVKTIYRLASHFIAYMTYDMRDIIELEVPDSEVFEYVSKQGYEECVLLRLKKEWLVSILHFKDYITEPARGENALYYENEVFDKSTYHMCYSNSIVLSGHGYGDMLEYCMSPKLIDNISDMSIQRDYVQNGIYQLFKKYVYLIRHNLNIADIVNVDTKAVNAETPKEINPSLIHSFNVCKNSLYALSGVTEKDTSLTYKERCTYIHKM